jgi:Protein of unknown function (DUF3318)
MKNHSSSRSIAREISRLELLIPERVRDLVKIELLTTAKSPLIATRKIARDRCQMQVDAYRWQSVGIDLRNMLFWHEIGKIQNGAIQSDRSI